MALSFFIRVSSFNPYKEDPPYWQKIINAINVGISNTEINKMQNINHLSTYSQRKHSLVLVYGS